MKKQISPEEKLKKAELKAEARALIAKGLHEDTSELNEFLEAVIPHNGMDYYLYLVDDEKTKVNMRFDREEYINALCCLSQYNFNILFYHPTSFDGWKTNIHASSLNCLYVDIDDINFYADENDKESTLEFLKGRYKLPPEKLGDYAILSGRGIHLVYKIDPLYFHAKTIEITKGRKKYNIPNSKPCPHIDCENRSICKNSEKCINIDIFKKYTNSLAVEFGSDFSSESINHMYRCPTSYNNKEREIKGKIFKLNASDNTDIHRLDWALRTDKEIKEYRNNHYAARGEKSKTTQQRNQQKKADFLKSLGNQTIEGFLERTDISPEDRNYALKLLAKIKEEEIKNELNRNKQNSLATEVINETDYYDDGRALPYKHLTPYINYKPQNRNWNLILDLHNFFIAHKGRLVSRNFFFFIISNYLKMMGYSSYYAVKYCRKYVDRNYYDEMEATVNATYNNETIYYFTYDYIASALCFSDTDIKNSYCNFSPERRKEAKRLNNQRYYQKKKAETGLSPAKQKRAYEVEFIKNNPDIKWQEAKEKLGISRSKFFAIRKEIGLSA